MNPLKVLQTLEEVAGDNALMVADGGDFVGTAAYVLRYVCADTSLNFDRYTASFRNSNKFYAADYNGKGTFYLRHQLVDTVS